MTSMRRFCIRMTSRKYWTNARAQSQLERRGKRKRDYFEKTGSIGGFSSGLSRYEMNRAGSLGVTRRRLTLKIANKLRRKSKERTLRYEKKLTKHPCSKRSSVRQQHCERFCRK